MTAILTSERSQVMSYRLLFWSLVVVTAILTSERSQVMSYRL